MRYYVNKNAQTNSGDHEVHTRECSWLPDSENRIYLGDLDSCSTAIRKAKEYYSDVNGCYYCSRTCHTG